MSGKPAARQGDMTQYGGPIVQGSAGVRIGAPTGVACSVCPGGMTSGNPVNPLLGAKVLPGETDLALPGPLPFILSRTYSSYRTKTPAPVGGAFTLSRCCRGRRCTAAVSQCGWCVAVRQHSRTAIRWRGCGGRCRRISG
ncbi:type IV secretion protein Rhs [Escherichia coli]|nr:type IV secretion protein Rhs [Escherichia coli]GDO67626.1 type IV secretion protein Rhs [Escherichia coli]